MNRKCVISDDVVLKINKDTITTTSNNNCNTTPNTLTIETPSDEEPNKMLLDSNCDTQARTFIAESGL